jgi:opacity protein-like surface antigen
MKREFSLLICICFLGFYLPSQAQAAPRLSLRVAGGPNWLDGGDLNAGANGWFNIMAAAVRAFGFSTEGEFSPAKLGLNFGGDVVVKINKTMGVGISVGLIGASRKSISEFSSPTDNGNFSHTVEASAVPLRLSFFYDLPSVSRINVYLTAGAGYYLAKARYEQTQEFNGATETTEEYTASAGGPGFHGGLGLEYALSSKLGLVVELTGRFASIGGFDGEAGAWSGESGTLWYFDMASPTGTYPLIYLSGTKPSSPVFSGVREAKISFTGFSFTAGFFVRL